MKTIELEEDLYRYIASQTKDIGESASDILRRLLALPVSDQDENVEVVAQPVAQNTAIQQAVTPVKQTIETQEKEIAAQTKVTRVETEVSSNPNLPGSIDKLIKSKEFLDVSVSVTKFIQILSVLYSENPTEFEAATDIKGRKRIYFAKSEKELLSSGSTTKPRKIENTPYWVITNTNTGRKRNMITQLMAEMGYPHALIDAVSQSI